MDKSPKIEELPDGAQRRDNALSRALRMAPAPFTPKPVPKVAPKKKKSGK